MQARNPQQIFTVATIMWLAFMTTQIMFAGVAYFMHQSSGLVVEPILSESFKHPIVLVISAMALMNLGLSQTLPRVMMAPNADVTAEKSFQLTLLRCTLAETVGVFGLVGAFITHQCEISYIFSACAFLAILVCKPVRDEFK